jgi:hypothetical protein
MGVKLEQTSFLASRISDKAIVNGVYAACKELGTTVGALSVHYMFGHAETIDQPETNKSWQELLNLNTIACRRLDFTLNNGVRIGVHRPANDQFTKEFADKVNITPPDPFTVDGFAKTIRFTRQHLGSIDDKSMLDFMREEDKQHYQQREDAIRRLEEMQAGFFTKFQEFAVAQAAANQKRQDDQEEKYTARLDDLNKQHQERMDFVAAREAELEQRKKEIDDRDSRHARRQLQLEIQKKLAERSTQLELTKGTKKRRGWVAVAFVVFLTLLAGLDIYYLFFQQVAPTDQVQATALLIHKAIITILFATAFWFFIRWLNEWSNRHVDVEFRQKQFELDMARASWVVEMALEWQDQKGGQIPSFLIERLSRTLFVEEGRDAVPITPAEALASAVLGNETTADVQFNNVKLGVGRKGRDRRPGAKPAT